MKYKNVVLFKAPAEDRKELIDCLKEDDFTGIVFTSPRAVESIPVDQNLTGKDVYVVGPATRDLVKDKFGVASLGADTGSGDKLAQFIVQRSAHSRPSLLLPCSSLANDSFTTILGEHNIACRRINTYETSENVALSDHLANLDPFHIAVFFSPSGVTSALPRLLAANDDEQAAAAAVRYTAIGQTTQRKMNEYVKDVRCAEKPSPES